MNKTKTLTSYGYVIEAIVDGEVHFFAGRNQAPHRLAGATTWTVRSSDAHRFSSLLKARREVRLIPGARVVSVSQLLSREAGLNHAS